MTHCSPSTRLDAPNGVSILAVLLAFLVVPAATRGQDVPARHGIAARSSAASCDTSTRAGAGVVAKELIVKLRAPAGLEEDADGSKQAARAARAAQEISGAAEGLARRSDVASIRPLFPAASDGRGTAWATGQQARLAERAQRAPAGVSDAHLERLFVVTVAPDASAAEVRAALAEDPSIEYTEPNAIARVAWQPDDPFFSSSGTWSQPYADLWGLHTIGAEAAWDTSRGRASGGRRIVVAVVDTGVDLGHPDLQGNLWRNEAEIPGNGIDDDGNGFVDDSGGWNFVTCEAYTNCGCGSPGTPGPEPQDLYGHGTHVAGTIAAVADNGIGVAGVAPEALVMAVRSLNRYGDGATSDLVAGIHYATVNGAEVINLSWGSLGTSPAVRDVIAEARAAGVVVVAAAGNRHGEDALGVSPANVPEVITVAAASPADDPSGPSSDFSCRGSKLDVAAPGVDVLSLRADGTDLYGGGTQIVDDLYYRATGTSMAAPHVAGTAALILAAHPELGVDEVRRILQSSAQDIGAPGFDPINGYGRLNAAAAVVAAAGPLAQIASPKTGDVLTNPTRISIRGTAAGNGFVNQQVRVRRFGGAWKRLGAFSGTPVEGSELATWNAATAADGVYQIELTANGQGTSSHDLQEVVLVHDPGARPRFPLYLEDRVSTASPVAADLDHDGVAEIVLAGLQTLYVFHADGTLLWQRSFDGFISSPALADLDRDGKLEVILEDVGCTGVHLRVLDAAGMPRFTRSIPVTAAALKSYPAIALTVGDLDRDGTPEILVPQPNDNFFVYSSVGVLKQRILAHTDGAAAALADLDGDGWPEVVVTTVLPGPDGGRDVHKLMVDRATRRLKEAPGWPVRLQKPGEPNAGGISFRGPIAVDLDRDGKLEVAISTGGKVSVLRHDGKPRPGWPRSLGRSDDFGFLAAGDLDGDGKPELVLGTWADGIFIFRGDGKFSQYHGEPGDAFEASPVIADIDGDGRSEILIQPSISRFDSPAARHLVAIDYKPATKTYETLWTKTITSVVSYQDYDFAGPLLGDFDGDKRFDLIVASPRYTGLGLMAWTLAGTSQGRKVDWPMTGHDARHTNKY
ncbi:MAG: S8 family serine peptidase [Acidobacteriota bacterium]